MILVIVGYSASGKDSISRVISDNFGYKFVISTSTRPMRPGESQKNPYYFTTNEEFEKLIENNELIEYRKYITTVEGKEAVWYYGVENKEIDIKQDYIVVLDIVGLREFKKEFGDKVISFFLFTDDDTRKDRCVARGDFDETEWERRLADDKLRFPKEVIYHEMDFVVDSYNVNETVKTIMELAIVFNKENEDDLYE